METYKVGLALEPDNQELKDGLAYAYATGHVVCVVSYVLLDVRARPRYGRTPRGATAGSAHADRERPWPHVQRSDCEDQ
jgi:hypothetical protein